MKNSILFLIALFTLSGTKCNEVVVDPTIKSVFEELESEFPQILQDPDKYEVQVRYTQINLEDKQLKFDNFDYHVDPLQYFYPASTVKMPVAFLALEKLEMIQSSGYKVDIDTPIRFGKGMSPQTKFKNDATAKDSIITLRHLINRVFTVSDNNAYNRLYEFVGRDDKNKALRAKGFFKHSRIISRVGVSGFDYETNAFANPFEFYNDNGVIYTEIVRKSSNDFRSLIVQNSSKGLGYIDSEDELINEPFNMSDKNFINIEDLEASLQRVIYPEYFSEESRFQLNEYHYSFLRHAMARLPREQEYPKYDREEYHDSYVKLFMFGDNQNEIPDHIRIFNKVGYAYGTLTDCAFIVDLKYDIAFFLTATIQVNENQIFNDGVYEYDEVGIPFLASLGRKIYDLELSRDRPNYDLDRFKMNYNKELPLAKISAPRY